MDAGLAPILFVLVVSMTAVQSQIQKGPANALKKTGDSVTLECVTVNKNCHQVDWQKVEGLQSPKLVYRNGQGMLNTHSYPTTRYSVNENGGCSLTITKLEIGDSGRFMCLQSVGEKEDTRISVLVVISVVTGSCVSNSNALNAGDGYSLWCAINVPVKTVEPSDVALVLPTETAGEINTTTNGTQPRTTLNGRATKENITHRLCRASFPPNPQANCDGTTATLDICNTTKLIVSYPLEKIAVSPSDPYHKGDTIRCTADGHPTPTFKWTHGKSGSVVYGDTLVIKGDVGDKYTCTATNMVKGREASQSITIEVSARTTGGLSDVGKIGIGVAIGVGGMLVLNGILFAVLCMRSEWIKRTETEDKRTTGMEEDSERSRTNEDNSNTPQYEPLNVLSAQNSNAGPTYAQLTTPIYVDIVEQSLPDRATYEDLGYKLNANESSLTEYESLQQRKLPSSDAYESIKPKQKGIKEKF